MLKLCFSKYQTNFNPPGSYREGFYPMIEHVNWLVYFTSLGMLQFLPFIAAGIHNGGDAPRFKVGFPVESKKK